MMAKAKGVKTNFVVGEDYDVSDDEAKIYIHRRWVTKAEGKKK